MLDNPYIILIIVAASILRWLWQKSREEKEESERPVIPDQPIPRASETQTEEDRIRRFLEALGQPPGTSPPPKVAPKRRAEPTIFPTLPPLATVPPPLPAQAPTPPAPPPLPMAERIFTPAIAQETGFEVRDVGRQTSSELAASSPPIESDLSSWRSKLASPQGLRTAIILREVFGPPRSMQAPDLVGSL